MPIEREFKFVLENVEGLEEEIRSLPHLGFDIQQGYLAGGGRIRSRIVSSVFGRRLEELNTKSEFFFNYKHKLSDRPGDLEFECLICQADFDLAWPDAEKRVTKTRYELYDGESGLKWEVDFFRSEGQTYFVLAECEVPEHLDVLPAVHPFVSKHLIYAVEESDTRFTNRKLSSPDRVAQLLKEIVE